MSNYSKLTVANLRGLLKDRQIPSTGLTRKQQIIDALEKADLENAEQTESPDAHDANDEPGTDEGDEKDRDAYKPTTAESTDTSAAVVVPEEPTQPAVEQQQSIATRSSLEVATDVQLEKSEQPVASPLPPPTEVKESQLQSLESADTPTAENRPQVSHTASIESVQTEELVEDRRKRKRRSATPPVIESEVVSKKLRQADDDGVAHLAEDVQTEDSQAQVTAEGGMPHDLQQDSEHDANLQRLGDVSAQVESPVDASAETKHVTAKEREGRYKDLLGSAQPQASLTTHAHEQDDKTVAPSLHPATCALYIRNLQRPLNPSSLRSHLVALATPANTSAEASILVTFHLDSIKSHAFAQFTDLAAASRVRSNLHDRTWPPERDRKALWVDFVPEESLMDWIEQEREHENRGHGSQKRWEVAYEATEDGLTARLVDIGAEGARRSSATVLRTEGVPAENPRLHESAESTPAVPHRAPERTKLSAPPLPDGEAKKFINLDRAFRSTTAKPKLYFLPAPAEVVGKRLGEFDRVISRGWSAKRGSEQEDEQLRRFSFEDGVVLVDGGIHPMPGSRAGVTRGGPPARRGGLGRGDGRYGSYRPY